MDKLPPVTYRDIVQGLRELGVEKNRPVIVHTSLSTFGEVKGGAESLIGALSFMCGSVLVPTFTYSTMVTPEVGPPDNGLVYGSGQDQNAMAEIWSPELPADKAIGLVPETLRQLERARRSTHLILSFAALDLQDALAAQTLAEPLAPIGWLAEHNGDVLLLGVDHTRNTAIHFGEKLAGRKQFIRWALTPEGTVKCPGFPGCSAGFQAIVPRLDGVARQAQVGEAFIQRIPLRDLLHVVQGWIREDPQALLCSRPDCKRCSAVRKGISTDTEGA